MTTRTIGVVGVVVIAAIVAGIALLGGDDETKASEIEGSFLAGMAPHHEMAIEMAELAQEKADHPEIQQLADDIIEAQTGELDQIDSIHQRLFGEPVSAADHASMGMSAEQMGMDMDMEALETAKPFDRAFIDAMIAHHQGAIRMARVELAEGDDAETKSLADAIIAAQSAEIEQMNEWRAQWYGAPSPVGGVPAEDEVPVPPGEGDGMEGM
jgi:uncharacterized protein (DUF305 family)